MLDDMTGPCQRLPTDVIDLRNGDFTGEFYHRYLHTRQLIASNFDCNPLLMKR